MAEADCSCNLIFYPCGNLTTSNLRHGVTTGHFSKTPEMETSIAAEETKTPVFTPVCRASQIICINGVF